MVRIDRSLVETSDRSGRFGRAGLLDRFDRFDRLDRGRRAGECEDEAVSTSPVRADERGRSRRQWIAPVVVALGSSLILFVTETFLRATLPADRLFEGYRFQAWSSNWMMQTIGLEDMQAFGPKALWLMHVYPPGLDAVRYLLMLPNAGQDIAVVQPTVDLRLYALYCALYGLLNALVYVWLRDLLGRETSRWWAIGGMLLWAVYPGNLMVATLLEGSQLSLITVAFAYYFLYRFCRSRRVGYATAFLAATLAASMTRSVVQTHVLVVLLVAAVVLWWLARNRRWWWLLANLVLVALMAIIPAKNLVLYGSFTPSTFGGYHRVGMLFLDPMIVPAPVYPEQLEPNALVFSSRYNTRELAMDNYRLEAGANAFVREHPYEAVRGMAASLKVTIPQALRPTSEYVTNPLVESMPWTGAYNWIFSGWRYLLLLFGAAVAIITSRGWRGTGRLVRRYGWFIAFWALIAFPVIFSNRYRPGEEPAGAIWTDAMRLKIFLEIPIYVALVYALYVTVLRLRRRRSTGQQGGKHGDVAVPISTVAHERGGPSGAQG